MADKILTLEQLKKELDKHNHKELHVHHTWRPNHATYFNTKAKNDDERALVIQQGMRSYHKGLGWADIGQHITLLPDGRFVTGRDFTKNPASIKGYNTGAFAMELLGDFDIGKDKFEGRQKESAIGLAKYFNDKGKYIRFHRENGDKTCPGTSIDKNVFMAEVISEPTKMPAKEPTKTPVKKNTWNYYINGNVIKDLQRELNRQFNANLAIDGFLGDKSINALVSVRKGARGNLTRIIQARLKDLGYSLGKVDGIFGEITERVVKRFQKDRKLLVDGIVGKNTWKELFRK